MPITIPPYFTTGELGDFLGVQAWKVARLFELKMIAEPARTGGRRLIPRALIPVVIEALRDRNWLDETAAHTRRGGDDDQ